MNNKSCMIVDDHPIFRKGLKMILETTKVVGIVHESSNGVEYLEKLKTTPVDLVIMDIKMPVMDGITAAKESLKLYPNIRILMLSLFDEVEYYEQLYEIGVKGFVLKDSETFELVTAIEKVMKGETFFSQKLLLNVLNRMKTKTTEGELTHLFTPREKEVLSLICQGHTNYEIGEKLFINHRTIERHRYNLMSKTKTTNSVSLVLYAIKNKLVSM